MVSHVQNTEREDGQTLNKEAGQAKAIQVQFGLRPDEGFFTQGRFATGSHQRYYYGISQLGQSLASRSDYAHHRVEWTGGYSLSSVALFAGLAWSGSERIIQPAVNIGGLQEKTSKFQVIAGLEKTVRQTRYSRLYLEGRALSTVYNRLKVDFAGIYDTARLDAGSQHGLQAKLVWAGKLHGGWGLELASYWRYEWAGASADAPLYRDGSATGRAFHQPHTRTDTVGLEATLLRLL